MPKGVVPPRITQKDKLIIGFLNGNKNVDRIEASNASTMSKTLQRRIATHKLDGLKSRCIMGVCYLEVDEGKRQALLSQFDAIETTRLRMLAETKQRQKDWHSTSPSTSKYRLSRKSNHLNMRISEVVDTICYDFSDSNKEFLKREIHDKITQMDLRGKAYHVQIAGLIYLLSKCPANSDKPLQFREVFDRYCKVDGHSQIACFYNAVRDAKDAGVQSYRITCEQIINSKKSKLYMFGTNNNISLDDIDDSISKSVAFAKQEALKRELMGKNPFVVSAASFYRHRGEHPAITQKEVGQIFNVTEVSIRNTLRQFESVLGTEQ